VTRVYEIPSSALTTVPFTPSLRCNACGFPKVYHVDGKLGHPFTPRKGG
jgi:hypothetical protein